MKSGMVTNLICIKDKGSYTELQVLRSNAGYYIGTMYNHPEGYEEPGSRDSGYFATHEEAHTELDAWNKMEEPEAHAQMRQHP